MTVTRERFEQLVSEALDALPPWIVEAMDNVEVLVEDLPPAHERDLLGRYSGVPLTSRGNSYSWIVPDTITIYRSSIMAVAGHDDDRVRAQVRRTISHEIAHHFGITDDRLREIDAY